MTRTKFIFWFVALCANLGQLRGFNIYEDNVDIFRGDSGSLFGYSVLQHENSHGKWILVGAPNSSSEHQRSLQSPGALYKCAVSGTRTSPADQRCTQVALDMTGNGKTYYDRTTRLYNMDVKDNQWLGVSLDRHQGASGHLGQFVVCGHRWMRRINNRDSFDRQYNQYSFGTCYTIDSELQTRGVAIQPCLEGPTVDRGIFWHGMCQAGSSAHYTNDGTLLLGAPGTIGWRGTVIAMRKSYPAIAPWSIWFPGGDSGREAYVGYSLSSGSFTKSTANEGVTGAPRAYEFGKVFIFDVNTFKVMIELVGEQMNTYFGSSVLAVDLNADGFSDLLVGAPLYTDKMDEGRVYVYINHRQGNLQLLQERLKGNNAIGARFGSAIANVGDLNLDGYTDIAIGAPFEVDGSGAVYIYHGSRHGVRTKYVQRLSGKSAMTGITSFGNSISGGMDMDGNGYPDIVVGAHQNATAIYYRTQPVISVANSLRLIPDILSRNSTECLLGGSPVLCVRIEMCLRFTGHRLAMERGFNYTISADMLRTSQGLSSRFFFTQNTGSKDTSIMTSYVVLQKDQETCVEHTAYLKLDVRDFLTVVQFKSTYNLHEPVDESRRLPYSIDPGYPRIVAKGATFVRDCGNDNICETDIQVATYLETHSNEGVLYLGDDTALNVDITVTNDGEEAHQALLTVWYPSDVVYEGFQHVTGEFLPCDLYQDDQIHCRLGNPMAANTKVNFKLRFDVSALNNDREDLNLTHTVETSSKENNGTLHDNTVTPSIPVKVLADIFVRGTSSPEQVIYDQEDTDEESLFTYLEDVRQVVTKIEESDDKDPGNTVVVSQQDNVGNEDETGEVDMDIDETIIGPSVVFTFEVSNLGPGFIPQYSNVNISVPWRLKNGDWMLYLKELKAMDGVKECNMQDVLKEQSSNIKEHYNRGSRSNTTNSVDIDTENYLPLQHKSGVYTLDCSSVSCVTITCQIDPLHESESAVIELHSLLWKHTFLQHEISMAEMKTEAFVKVVDPSGRFTQPEDHRSDKAQVMTNIATERILKAKPIPAWVIIVAIAGGILLLTILIIIMAKLGFFRRISKEEMERLLEENDKDTNANGPNETEDIKESKLEDVGYDIPMTK